MICETHARRDPSRRGYRRAGGDESVVLTVGGDHSRC